MDMTQQEPSTLDHVGMNANDTQLCSWFTPRQRPINSALQKREHSGSIDADNQDRPAHKLKRCEAAAGVITPQFELSPPPNSDVMSFQLPFFISIKGLQSPCSSTEDIYKIAAGAGKDAVSSMDDEPVWDNMRNIAEPSVFASSLQQPALNTRKVTADFDENTNQDDLPGGIFGWFTDNVDQDQDVLVSKSSTFASFVSGNSSDNLTSDDEAKQPSLFHSVSLEVEESSSVINRKQLLKGMEGEIDAMNLDEPVFEDVILDSTILNPSGSLEDMFNFPDESKSARQTPCSLFDGDHLGFASSTHLTTLDPLPYLKPESATPAVKEASANIVTPKSLIQDTSEIMAIDMLADVADAASMELMDDPLPLAAAYIFDSSSSNENKMMTPHQSSKKKETNKRSVCAWRKKFDELRDYARENGHCNVPQKYPGNPSLGRWVARQRFFMRQCLDAQGEANAALPSSQIDIDERMKLLRTIGLKPSPNKKGMKSSVNGIFISCRNTKEWDNRFAELLRYKSIHGDCDVPVKSDGEFKSLGRWVTSQRKKHKDFHSGTLNGDNAEEFLTRFHRLEEIGFKFKIGSGRGNSRPGKASASGKRKPARVSLL